MIATIKGYWLPGLTAVLAGYYLCIGFAVRGATGLAAIVGGLVVLGALCIVPRSRAFAGSMLVAGALPFALLTWWSIVTPITAALLLLLGGLTLRAAARP